MTSLLLRPFYNAPQTRLFCQKNCEKRQLFQNLEKKLYFFWHLYIYIYYSILESSTGISYGHQHFGIISKLCTVFCFDHFITLQEVNYFIKKIVKLVNYLKIWKNFSHFLARICIYYIIWCP